MPATRILRLFLLASLLFGVVVVTTLAPSALAQGKNAGGAQNPSQQLPVHHPDGTKLNEQQLRGAYVFFQRCSLCHLAKTYGSGGSKYCCVASLGPNLAGLFKDASPDQEKALREFILNGGPTYMPSWKYALTSKQIDDIISYLKTLD